MEEHVVEIIAGTIFLMSNGGMLLWMFKKVVTDIDKIKEETDEVRLNYLARFDDVKDVMNANHLDIVQRMIKLETILKQTQLK